MPTCTRCGREFSPSYAKKFPTAKVCGRCALDAMFGFFDSEDDEPDRGLPPLGSVELITSNLIDPDKPAQPVPFEDGKILVSRDLLARLKAKIADPE